MKDIGTHLLLFGIVGVAIVVLGAIFAEPDDREAIKSLKRRFLWFFGGCAAVALVMLALEHTVASVN